MEISTCKSCGSTQILLPDNKYTFSTRIHNSFNSQKMLFLNETNFHFVIYFTIKNLKYTLAYVLGVSWCCTVIKESIFHSLLLNADSSLSLSTQQ